MKKCTDFAEFNRFDYKSQLPSHHYSSVGTVLVILLSSNQILLTRLQSSLWKLGFILNDFCLDHISEFEFVGRCEKNNKHSFYAFVQNKDDHRLTKLTNKQTNSKIKMSTEYSFNSNIDKRQSNTLLHYLTVKCEIPIFGGYHPSTIRFCKPSFSDIQFTCTYKES